MSRFVRSTAWGRIQHSYLTWHSLCWNSVFRLSSVCWKDAQIVKTFLSRIIWNFNIQMVSLTTDLTVIDSALRWILNGYHISLWLGFWSLKRWSLNFNWIINKIKSIEHWMHLLFVEMKSSSKRLKILTLNALCLHFNIGLKTSKNC